MIVGIGVDVVDVPRFVASLERTPAMIDRLFTAAERVTDEGRPRTQTSLAARFAAKEAVAKALGAPQGMAWHDCEVVGDSDGRPWLRISGTVADAAAAQGIDRWHLSLSHDGDVAVAYVVAESWADAAPSGTSVVTGSAETAPRWPPAPPVVAESP